MPTDLDLSAPRATAGAASDGDFTPSTAAVLPAGVAHGQHWRGVLAAVDLGSNSFRLELGQLREDGYQRIAYLKEPVRLGSGLDADSRIGDEARARALACLRRFRERLGGLPAAQLRAVATQTLREASNRDDFLGEAAEALGYPIEVISGREEARLIYAGVTHIEPGLAVRSGTTPPGRLVVDIGGRSTELILGRGATPVLAESFAVGSASLSQRCFPAGRCTERAFREAQTIAGAAFEEAVRAFRAEPWIDAVGSSGTASAVSQLLVASGRSDGDITVGGLQWLMRRCIEADRVEALDLPGLRDDRRAVLPGGLAILAVLMQEFAIDELRPTRAALRQGVIFDLDQRIRAAREPDTRGWRDETTVDLQRRFQVDLMQAARVQALALHLFDQCRAVAGRPLQAAANDEAPDPVQAEARLELGWAAALHEIGMSISHHDHHRHSAYLLAHIDAPGFSQSQQRRMADLVLGQRGGLRKIEASLSHPVRRLQVLALRLAALLCHGRGELRQMPLTVQAVEAHSVRILLDAEWARQHPRSVYLLREEARAWDRSGELALLLDTVG